MFAYFLQKGPLWHNMSVGVGDMTKILSRYDKFYHDIVIFFF